MKNKVKGTKFENQVKNSLNSGALWFDKSDISSATESIECKVTDKKGFRITTKILEKLWSEALSHNKEPFLVIGIKRNERERFVLSCRLTIERQ